jgi:alpha-beta hydrolase superfamily lysophospholipase
MARVARMGPLAAPALCLIGTEERVVDVRAVREGAARLGAEIAEIEGGRHELLIERAPVRAAAWAEIDRFLAGVAASEQAAAG